MSVTQGDVFETFEQYDLPKPNQAIVVKKCVELCNKYELSADNLANKCELIIYNKQDGKGISLKDLLILEKKVKQQWEARQTKYRIPQTPARMRKPLEMNLENLTNMDMLSQALNVKAEKPSDSFITPIKDVNFKRRRIETPSFGASPSILASPASESFKSRPNIGKSVHTYNRELKASKSGMKLNVEIPVNIDNPFEGRFRYMYDEVYEKSENLNSITSYLMRRLEEDISSREETKKNEEIEFSPVNFPAQKSVFIAGRVVCDAEGKLNAQSVLLEGDRATSAGNSIRLDISKLESYALFPGQVVALQGLNSTGQCFVASKAFQPKCPAPRNPSVDELQDDTKSLQSRPTSVMIASGPFTTSDNMLYWPLNALLECVEEKQPDVLVLAGPFVDSAHRDVCMGNLDLTFEAQYEAVMHTIEQKLAASPTRVLVLPSLNDVHHHNVFPQPPAPAKSTTNIEYLPNPASFKINDINFGIVNSDILMHMSKQEISRRAPGDKLNRLARLSSHLISQRSFYPLYPPVKGANVDHSHYMAFRMIKRPDVLITPGDLRYFAQTSADKKSVCVNPGHLSKGTSGGTYAMLTIHNLKEKMSGNAFDRKPAERIRVDIVRI